MASRKSRWYMAKALSGLVLRVRASQYAAQDKNPLVIPGDMSTLSVTRYFAPVAVREVANVQEVALATEAMTASPW
jgi:hypothetical protein